MPTVNLNPDQPFDLDATLSCGQVFRWERAADGWWRGVVGNRVLRIRQRGDTLAYAGAPEAFIIDYFSLDTDLEAVLASIDTDPFMHACIARSRGLRLIRQPPWECTISYICSTNSNIPTIRRRIAAIAERFGRPLRSGGRTYHAFPEPPAICAGGREGVAACRLGYRDSYVFCTSGFITDENAWEQTIRGMSYADARKELTRLNGVGPKAADCILLFAFQKFEAFPVDVWIRRIIQRHYLPDLDIGSPLSTREYKRIRNFALKHFGKYCGYAQEYLYAGRGLP